MAKQLEWFKVVYPVQDAMGFEVQATSKEFAQALHPEAKVTLMRYFLFDCLGQKVGNPDGYTTHIGASRVFNGKAMQVRLLDLAHENMTPNLSGAISIGKIKHLTV